MRMPSGSTVEKAGFILSMLVLAYLFGIATHAFSWFPSSLLNRAWDQAKALDPFNKSLPIDGSRRVYDQVGANAIVPDEMQPGLTLIASVWEEFGWKPGLKLIDKNGRTVHRWAINGSQIFPPDLRNQWGRWKETRTLDHRPSLGTYLFPDGDVLINVGHVGTTRLDACGRVVWRLSAGNHHSLHPVGDGSFWVPGGKYNFPPQTPDQPDGLPGLDGPIDQDLLLHVSSDGKILHQINVLDVLYGNGLERYILKGSHAPHPSAAKRGDITHLNDVEPLPDSLATEYPLFDSGDIVVSLRDLDLIFVLDPESRRVKWYESRPFIGQHDPDFIGDGWIGVFDNNRDGTERGTMLGGSRIVAIQPHTDSTKVLFPTSFSEPFYTEVVGQWQKLENGNLLLTESVPGRVVEVNPDGRTIWEWVHAPVDTSTVPSVQEASRYDLTAEQVANWPCSLDGSEEEANGQNS